MLEAVAEPTLRYGDVLFDCFSICRTRYLLARNLRWASETKGNEVSNLLQHLLTLFVGR